VDRSGCLSERMSAPSGTRRDDLRTDRDGGLLRRAGADVETDRRPDTGEASLVDARFAETLDPPLMRPTRSHRAEIPHVRGQRADDGGYVELRVVGEHAHRVAWTELLPDLLQVPVGPVVDDLVGEGEALPGREHRARVAHRHAVAEHLRDLGER